MESKPWERKVFTFLCLEAKGIKQDTFLCLIIDYILVNLFGLFSLYEILLSEGDEWWVFAQLICYMLCVSLLFFWVWDRGGTSEPNNRKPSRNNRAETEKNRAEKKTEPKKIRFGFGLGSGPNWTGRTEPNWRTSSFWTTSWSNFIKLPSRHM